MFLNSAWKPPAELHSSAVQRVHEYVRNTSKQHRVLQFFTEDEIRKQLHELHTQLGASYTVRNQLPFVLDYFVMFDLVTSSRSPKRTIHMTNKLRRRRKRTARRSMSICKV